MSAFDPKTAGAPEVRAALAALFGIPEEDVSVHVVDHPPGSRPRSGRPLTVSVYVRRAAG